MDKKVIDGFSKVSEAGNGSMIFLSSNPPDTDICKTVRLEEFVSSYDIQFLALHCLGPFETEDSKGAYIAQLVSNLVGLDSRLAARLAGYSLYADPVSCYKGKEESGKLLSDDRIQEAIWEAQIRFVLPITEKFRRYIIKNMRIPLSDAFLLMMILAIVSKCRRTWSSAISSTFSVARESVHSVGKTMTSLKLHIMQGMTFPIWVSCHRISWTDSFHGKNAGSQERRLNGWAFSCPLSAVRWKGFGTGEIERNHAFGPVERVSVG